MKAHVYAVILSPGAAQCFLGRSGEDHLRLLRRIKRVDVFTRDPVRFVMGRYFLNSDLAVADVVSDLYGSAMGMSRANPLSNCSAAHRTEFERCLKSCLKAGRLYIINMGGKNRANSVTPDKLRQYLKDQGPQFYLVK